MFSAGDNKLGITIYTISLYSKNEVEVLLLQFDWPVFAVIVFIYIYTCASMNMLYFNSEHCTQ